MTPSGWRMAAALVAAALGCAAAAAPVTTVYAPGPVLALLGAAAAAGVTVTAGLRAVRLGAATALLASLVTLAVVTVLLGVWLPHPDGSLPGAALAAVRYSGARFLTTSVPVPVSLDTVALPVWGTWLAAAGAAGLLFSRRPGLATAPPVVLFVGAVALVGPPARPAYGPAVVLVVALVGLLAAIEQQTYVRLRGLATAGFAGLVVVTAGLAGPPLAAVGDRQPPDLRAYVEPPYLDSAQVNPLSVLAGWAVDPDVALLEVRTDRPAPLRWVVLSEFNGITWTPARQYRAAGALLPAAPVPEAPGPVVSHHEVTVTGLAGSWLPAPHGTREVAGVRVAVDAATGTLVAADGLRPGARYTVGSQPPAWTTWGTDRLAAARLSTADALDADRTLPAGAPGRLLEIAAIATGPGGPYQQASQLAGYLRENYRFDPSAPGGNGYPSLRRFLDPGQDDCGCGTSEQFATAFVALARSLGLPARVVVGFGPGEPVGGDRYLVRTGDARAWGEVHIEGVGWVPFDPTPPEDSSDDRPLPPTGSELLFPPEGGDEEDGAGQPEPTPSVGPSSPPESATGQPPGRGAGPPALGWLAVPIGVLVGMATVVLLRVRRSAARLGRGSPAARLFGGWAEVRDGLRLIGRRPDPTLTAAEVAGLAVVIAGGAQPQVPALAAAVNRAAFGGTVPPEPDLDSLLAGVRAYRRDLRRRAGWRRVTWLLDPRPLWWR
jgi:transglutaminase-like putative cysteine protease